MYKIIYSRCNDYPLWIDVAEKLIKEYNIYPCYWIAREYNKDNILNKFPYVVFHSEKDVISNIKPKKFSHVNLPALDKNLLNQLAIFEPIALKMMSRFEFAKIFTYEERKRYYYYQLRFWQAVLDYFKPDIFITRGSPHIVWDYILYILCQNKGIKTILFQNTSIPGIMIPVEKFEYGSEKLRFEYKNSLYNQSKPVKLSASMENYYNKMQGSYSTTMPDYVKDYYNKSGFLSFFKWHYYKKLIYKVLRHPKKIKRIPLFIKGRFTFSVGLSLYFFNKTNNKLLILSKYYYSRLRMYYKKKLLFRYYNSLCNNTIDLKKPYIFVALHLQPECTTSPEGGVYEDQLLMIDILSKVLPKGWFLYVKENPAQFRVQNEQGGEYRNYKFYDILSSYENIKLVPINYFPNDFIDSSKAVATVTGTIGWEAVLRGKPALVFGYSWYRDCEGVFYTPSLETCKNALLKIVNGYQVNREHVKLFINVLEQKALKATFNPNIAKNLGMNYEYNVSAIVRAINYIFNSK